jgi:hypothetical protein
MEGLNCWFNCLTHFVVLGRSQSKALTWHVAPRLYLSRGETKRAVVSCGGGGSGGGIAGRRSLSPQAEGLVIDLGVAGDR